MAAMESSKCDRESKGKRSSMPWLISKATSAYKNPDENL